MNCLIVSQNTVSGALSFIEDNYEKADLFEVRLDYLTDTNDANIDPLFSFDKTVIATCRDEKDCGLFNGTVESKLNLLKKSLDSGADYIDVEIENINAFTSLPTDKIILSKHFHLKDGESLEDIYQFMNKHNPAFIKIVLLNDKFNLNDQVFKLLDKFNSDNRIIAHQCGVKGQASRLLYKRFNCPWTYISVDDKNEVAPGMITCQDALDHNITCINKDTQIYGIIGKPIKYALSPGYFNKFFKKNNLNCVYLPFELDEVEDLSVILNQKTIDVHGLSVTMPFKQDVLKYADEQDESVTKTEAANTIKIVDGKIHLYNTDYLAIKEMLEDINLDGQNAVIIGAGGVAKTAASVLKSKKCNVYIANRTVSKAEALVHSLKFGSVITEAEIIELSPKLIVNTTPIGMGASKELPIPESCINKGQIIFDVIHNPEETELLKIAKSKGSEILKGIDMYRLQAKHQMLLWRLLK